MKAKRKTPLMDKLGGRPGSFAAAGKVDPIPMAEEKAWVKSFYPVPEPIATDILRRRVALDQRQSLAIVGRWWPEEDADNYWDSIPLASTQEASRALACPNDGNIFDWQPDGYSMLPTPKLWAVAG